MQKRTRRILILTASALILAALMGIASETLPGLLGAKPIYGIPLGGPIPTAAVADPSYTFAFTGDTRNNNAVLDEIIREAMDEKCAFSVYGGDLVANSSDRNYEDFCQAVIKTTGGKFPFYPAIGNHDWGHGVIEKLGGDRFVEYLGPENYSFWYGSDAFVLIDDSRDDGFTAEHAAVAEALLAEVRPRARYVFLVCHIPPFDPDPAGSHCLGPASANRLMKLAAKYNVTLLLASHVHGFGERTIEGVRVLISGGAGAKLVPNGRFNWVKISVNAKGVATQLVELPAAFQGAAADVGAHD